MKKIIVLIIFLLLVPIVTAKQGHMVLLAVEETSDGIKGSTADLYLELKKGTGRVFLDTFPLTKVDTQMSTRFAKEIACNYLDVNCDDYDFIYTIRADSVIIGGPSGGAAITALTIAMLENIEIGENVTITGTINSGGLVGPVGSLKEKIKAASKSGIKKVLIAKGERFVKENPTINESTNKTINETTDLVEYGNEHNLSVIEVSDIDDVMYKLTGKRLKEIDAGLMMSLGYLKTMKNLAADLCNRSKKLEKFIAPFDKKINKSEELSSIKTDASDLQSKGKDAFDKKTYYSSASYCFGANLKYNYLSALIQNLTKKELLERSEVIRKGIDDFNEKLEKKQIKTITDLEAYMVVKERLVEAENFLRLGLENINNTKNAVYNLVYASERVYSAYSWSQFFGKPGKEFVLNNDILKKSCMDKLSEAEERYQYVKSFLSNGLEDTEKELGYAYKDLENGDYELCLFKASKAKAEADVILSVIHINEDKIDNLIEQKLEIIKKNIIEVEQKGIFPVLGYSYYEYANELKDSDKYATLLYSGYALELSNLDLYFKEKKRINMFSIDKKIILVFFTGILIGFLISRIFRIKPKRKKINKRKKRKKK